MRTIERSSAFKRDFRRAKADGRNRNDLDSLLSVVVTQLACDRVPATRNRDHGLTGEWAGYRECHIKPDLLLIYSKPDAETLRLVRLGSHSELFR